ncbi:MAG: hypothetical protein ACT4OO_09935 [Nitrospiraceae bacterium]
MKTNGILLLYHRPTLRKGAATVEESIEAFGRYSQFRVWSLNTEYGFSRGLSKVHFPVIVLHYSLFGGWDYPLDKGFCEYLDQCTTSYKIAFFQDEHRYCRQRFSFLNRYKIDCVYTLIEPEYFKDTYRKYTAVPTLLSHIPGYVGEGLIEAAGRFGKPDRDRIIDIGYRGRPLAFYMGKGAQEKSGIATGFLEHAKGLNLKFDIACSERERLYGDDWYRFTAECRAFLGVEAGVSIFDVDDVVREECDKLLDANPGLSFQEVADQLLHRYEDRMRYRTISPRHFEAAAFRVCQILFEGNYSGILKPMVHYIPLKKDFSNFDEVIRRYSDDNVRRELTDNAYRDLIASGQYSYKHFVAAFDTELVNVGLKPGPMIDPDRVTTLLESGSRFRKLRAGLLGLRFYGDLLPGPIRKLLRPISHRAMYRRPVSG